jgi:hypothetical protein
LLDGEGLAGTFSERFDRPLVGPRVRLEHRHLQHRAQQAWIAVHVRTSDRLTDEVDVLPSHHGAEQDTTMLGLITPGGTEGYFAEGGPVAVTPAPPPPDLERLQQAAEKYQCQLVGAPLTSRT